MEQRTTSSLERFLIALPWALLPLLALHFASLWSALPRRIATHFDLQGRPNGWQSPEALAIFAFVFLGFGFAIMSAVLLRALRLRSMARAAAMFMYLAIGTSFTLFWQTLDHAAFGRPMADVWPVPVIFPILGLLVTLACFGSPASERRSPAGPAILIAEEQHRSPSQLLLVAPGILIGIWLASRGIGIPRLLGVFLIAVMAWVGVAVLDGFRYLVRTDGVQIKGFLMPLRFIPRASIQSYRTQPWTGLGYGIRLTSTGTAYIWGGRSVVNIVTDSGNVMLGMYQPERLIHDLDRMMEMVH